MGRKEAKFAYFATFFMRRAAHGNQPLKQHAARAAGRGKEPPLLD